MFWKGTNILHLFEPGPYFEHGGLWLIAIFTIENSKLSFNQINYHKLASQLPIKVNIICVMNSI